MSIQNIDFVTYPASAVVAASIYASTAFLKHSKQYESPETTAFCTEVRKIIFSVLLKDTKEQSKFLDDKAFLKLLKEKDNRDALPKSSPRS